MDGAEYYWGDTKTCAENIDRINNVSFGYVAHPELYDSLRVPWQNYSLPFTGLEVWNSIGESWEHERDIALQKWTEQLRLGRKIFISAGSDAHGDFNSALGKVRTACFAKNFTKDNIFTALKNGNCMMTDGPLVTFTANKHIVGESFNISAGDTIRLNISWNSTNEFGNVTEIFLIRGEINGNETNETITPNNLSGNIIKTSVPNNTYYRIEAHSIDPDGKTRRAYTNPIWVYAESRPEIQKIPMDETEHALITTFEEKYNHSLKDLFFDGNDSTAMCNSDNLQDILNLSNSSYWTLVRCEKTYSNITRVLWATFNNTNTGEMKIILQADDLLQFANATYNQFYQNWGGCCIRPYAGLYRNDNWMAYKNGKEIFEINEISNTNRAGNSYFGTYLIHGFEKYEGSTAVYYTHWGPVYIITYSIHDVWINFDNAPNYPLAWEGFYFPGTHPGNFNRGVLQKRMFDYNASSFKLGADGERLEHGSGVEKTSFDAFNRSIFPVLQTDLIVRCHADIDCQEKSVCISRGTVNSYCTPDYTIVELGSPAHIFVVDIEGRTTGYVNGTYVTEIPGSEILDTVHEKYRLPSGSYRISVSGHETGNYSLRVTVSSNGDFYFRNISTSNETLDTFELTDSAITVKTNDHEKNISVDIETANGSQTTGFTISPNAFAHIFANWSNASDVTVTLVETNHPPEIISKSPNNGSIFSQWETIYISINATDEDNDTLEYKIFLDGKEISHSKELYYALNETGNHTIAFNVSDNMAPVSEEISISVVSLTTITITSPKNQTYNESEILLNAVFGEATSAAWISIDNRTRQNHTYSSTGINLMLDSLPEGAHNVRVYANNSAGGINSSAIFFTLDLTAPNINIISPANGISLPKKTKSVWINITTDENATCRYGTNSSFDYQTGMEFSTAHGTNHSFKYSKLHNRRTYDLYYKCEDAYGNVNDKAAHHNFGVGKPKNKKHDKSEHEPEPDDIDEPEDDE